MVTETKFPVSGGVVHVVIVVVVRGKTSGRWRERSVGLLLAWRGEAQWTGFLVLIEIPRDRGGGCGSFGVGGRWLWFRGADISANQNPDRERGCNDDEQIEGFGAFHVGVPFQEEIANEPVTGLSHAERNIHSRAIKSNSGLI